MRKFIKLSVMEEADTPEKLLRVNMEDTSSPLTCSNIDIVFKAETKLNEA